ncbi:hypothetical protein DXV76_02425 [Rhodobacteraceae bacterium CCMM004]|nr:hypothetical protein DXV76_02425 [Rhodobacteraceae bacterium CCMM004]
MSIETLKPLSKEIEAAPRLERSMLETVASCIAPVFPRADLSHVPEGDLTDAALHLIDVCLPGWTIALRGKAHEPDGHWRCSLREGSSRDNDMLIGHGKGPTVGLALADALVNTALQRGRG